MTSESRRPRLYLVDGTSNIYRAFFALRGGFTTRDGLPTNAVYGFTTMLRKLVKDEQPEYLGVCFDRGEPTFRHEQFKDYKAHRPEAPADLIRQVPLVKEITAAYRIPVIEKEGWEADDLIGTLAHQATGSGFDVVIVASDKDLFQLVGDHVRVLNPHKDNLLMDAAAVVEVFGARPDQVVDVLALMGDASDNIPGVPGIGEKGAKALIREFGGLDALLERAAEVPRRSYREALLAHAERARLSRELTRIRLDAPLTLDPEALRLGAPDPARLRDLFTRLEFTSLLADLRPDAGSSGADYRAVTREGELFAFLEEARAAGRVAVELETTGPEPMRATILGAALAVRPGAAIYVPVRHQAGVTTQLAPDRLMALLGPLLEDPRVAKVGQDCKFEYLLFRRQGVRMAPVAFDTMLAAYLLNPSRSHALADLAMEHLDYRTIPYADLAGRGARQVTLDEVDLARVVTYAGEGADMALRLVDRLGGKLASGRQAPLFESLEMPLLTVLAEMEFAGVRLDTDHLAALGRRMEGDLARLQAAIHAEAGTEFNLNSPAQLGEVLFTRLGIKPRRKTAKTKAFSTSQEVLEELAEDHPICARVLEWRSLAKLKGTYVDALPALVHPETGRVHTSFNQAVAATGRLSSSDPNLQNIPVRTEVGREIRRAFVPADGCVLLTADYSQVELRILAHLSGDEVLTAAFAAGEDIHARTAAEIFGVQRDLVSDEMRRRAKAVNFGILYGMRAQRLARDQGMSLKEAQRFIEAYFGRFAAVKAYIDATLEFAEREGYVTTLLDRVRYFPELRAADRMARQQALRAAVNTTVQGTAADLIKKAMVDIAGRLAADRRGARLIIQVHDELVLEVPQGEIEPVAALVRRAMEEVHPLKVPLAVDLGWGGDWVAAKEGPHPTTNS